MKSTLRKLLNENINIISIDHIFSNLRQRQYYNAMEELKDELKILVSLPNIPDRLKIKIHRSLEKILTLVNKLKENL